MWKSGPERAAGEGTAAPGTVRAPPARGTPHDSSHARGRTLALPPT